MSAHDATRNESYILRALFSRFDFAKFVIPHLKSEFFTDHNERVLYEEIAGHIKKFDEPPTEQTITLAVINRKNLDEQPILEYLEWIAERPVTQADPYLKTFFTDFIRDRGYAVAVLTLANDDAKPKDKDRAIESLQTIRSFSFDETTPGAELDPDLFYSLLHSATSESFPFDTRILNEKACGGMDRQTITIVQAPTGTAKSLFQCAQAAHTLRLKKNVLYLSVEMSEKSILRRIYANLFDTAMKDVDGWSRQQVVDADAKVRPLGKLKVRTWPPKSVHAGDFEHYIEELKRKENFVPDLICIDYLGEVIPRRTLGKNSTTFDSMGEVVSELRAIAVKYNVAVLTAAQTNRDGYEGKPNLVNTGGSYQINNAADLIIGVQKDDLIPDQLIFSILKVRDREHHTMPFIISVDKSKMKMYDSDDPETERKSLQAFNDKYTEVKKNKQNKKQPRFVV